MITADNENAKAQAAPQADEPQELPQAAAPDADGNEQAAPLADEPKAQDALELRERVGIVEAILFVAGDAVETQALCEAMGVTQLELSAVLDALESGYDFDRRGLRLLRFGTHVQLATRPEYAPYVERLLQPVQRQTLSQAVMETLAVIAYRQPVTKGEVEQVRGVKCDYSVQALLARGLIEERGRRESLGRPILYGTTDAFLRHFALSSLSDLPEIDFSALTRAAQANAEDANAADAATAAQADEGTIPQGSLSPDGGLPEDQNDDAE